MAEDRRQLVETAECKRCGTMSYVPGRRDFEMPGIGAFRVYRLVGGRHELLVCGQEGCNTVMATRSHDFDDDAVEWEVTQYVCNWGPL